jgi:fluoroquinolone transport system permease protein
MAGDPRPLRTVPAQPVPFPSAALTLELAALCIVALAASAAAAPFASQRRGSVIGAPILFALVAIGLLLPEGYRLLVESPADTGCAEAHRRWWWVAGAAAVGPAWWSADPGRRDPGRQLLSHQRR